VSLKGTDALATEDIPDLHLFVSFLLLGMCCGKSYLALEVVVASEEKTARDRESDGGDAAHGLGDL
jgi:hypothetical protein